MIQSERIKIKLRVDPDNQWFAMLAVSINNRRAMIEFKVDTGCNALVLSHNTLKSLGYPTNKDSLATLPSVSGALASGDKHVFRKLGKVSLYRDEKQTMYVCDAEAICHSALETHDLLGTEVLRRFNSVVFSLSGNRYMELMQ